MIATPRDWRGTPITPGAIVIYGAPVSRSIAMVEAVVCDGNYITPSGKIKLRVVRRAYGWATKEVVNVMPDRLTVVTELPPAVRPADR